MWYQFEPWQATTIGFLRYAFPEPLSGSEVATVWIYDIAALMAVDLAKMVYKLLSNREEGMSWRHFCTHIWLQKITLFGRWSSFVGFAA